MSLPKPGGEATLDQWLAYLESLHHVSIELGLDRVRRVAERLGLDLSASVRIIVGGTNGKGSTCAMLEAILLAAGYKVGLYTSPHLIDFNERIRVNGELATDAQIVEQFHEIEAGRGEISLSYFEYTTLAALRLFQKLALDVVVLEVGLGGRLDAVNIVDADCSVVTSVDMDHMEWLGDTRDKIGWEKAHISARSARRSVPIPCPRTRLSGTRWTSVRICGVSVVITTIRATVCNGPTEVVPDVARGWAIRRCAAPISC